MSQKSRVLILSTAYLPQVGGSELAIKNITDRLPEFEFDLITSRFSKSVPVFERLGNVNVYRVGNSLSRFSFLLPKNFLSIAVFLKARNLISKHDPYKIIHAYQASQAAGGGWLLKWIYPKIPFIVTIQEGKDLASQSWLMKFFRYLILRKADRATAISNYLARYVTSQNKNLPVVVIPNGVNTNKFTVSSLQFTDKEKTIITVSRLVEKNGITDLIDAIAVVVKKIPDIKLMIIGDGELKESLKFKVESLKLEKNIIFLGEISNDQLPYYLGKAMVFVRPSLSEGLGISFLEAMACGVPIIATPVGGIPDFLSDRVTGLFCKPKDPVGIADKIIEVLGNQNLRETLIHNARKLVEEKYNWDTIAQEFSNIYQLSVTNFH